MPIVIGGRRLANYLAVMTLEAQTIARACGESHLEDFQPEDICALSNNSEVPLPGTNWFPGKGTF